MSDFILGLETASASQYLSFRDDPATEGARLMQEAQFVDELVRNVDDVFAASRMSSNADIVLSDAIDAHLASAMVSAASGDNAIGPDFQ